tara:strand:+ start:160 stop:465 length:306 start_codon:yes stop_codon:yes gene_type:complete
MKQTNKTKMKQRNKKEKFNIGENPLSEINFPGRVYTKDDIEEAKQIRKEENKEIREWSYKMIEESDVDRPTMIKICIDKFGRRGRRLLKTIESKILNKEAI